MMTFWMMTMKMNKYLMIIYLMHHRSLDQWHKESNQITKFKNEKYSGAWMVILQAMLRFNQPKRWAIKIQKKDLELEVIM